MAEQTHASQTSAAKEGPAPGAQGSGHEEHPRRVHLHVPSNLVTVVTTIILILMAVWLINTLNGIKQELDDIREHLVTTLPVIVGHGLEGYQAVGADGKLAYTFRRNPELDAIPAGMPVPEPPPRP